MSWFFFPTVIILVAVALVTHYPHQQVTEELVIEHDHELTRLSAGQLAVEFEEYADLLDTLARTANIYQNDPIVQRNALSSIKIREARPCLK